MTYPLEIMDLMRELLLGGQFSDVDIICQGVTFRAHRIIICPQSHFLDAAFNGGFKIRGRCQDYQLY